MKRRGHQARAVFLHGNFFLAAPHRPPWLLVVTIQPPSQSKGGAYASGVCLAASRRKVQRTNSAQMTALKLVSRSCPRDAGGGTRDMRNVLRCFPESKKPPGADRGSPSPAGRGRLLPRLRSIHLHPRDSIPLKTGKNHAKDRPAVQHNRFRWPFSRCENPARVRTGGPGLEARPRNSSPVVRRGTARGASFRRAKASTTLTSVFKVRGSLAQGL